MKNKALFNVVWVCTLFGIASCNFQIPETLELKGSPGVYLPLGNPFETREELNISTYVSASKILEMVGGSGTTTSTVHKIRVYDYRPPKNPDVSDEQSYVVHYPIAEMSYDLSAYITTLTEEIADLSISIPQEAESEAFWNYASKELYLTENGPQEQDISSPLFNIPLGDIAALVQYVDLEPSGISMPYDSALEDHLFIKIPDLGFDDYIPGKKEGEFLNFLGKSCKLEPPLLNKDKIPVYVKLTGSCSGTITPTVVFNWTKANIKPGKDGTLLGNYDIDLSELMEFLGTDVKFTGIKGYVYVKDLPEGNATMTLKVGGKDLVSSSIETKERPPFEVSDSFIKSLSGYPHSISASDSISMTEVFSSEKTSLEYTISMAELLLYPGNDKTKVISADLVIELPLRLTVSAKPTDPALRDTHVKLNLGGDNMLPQAEKDLFGRTGNDDDDLFSSLDSVTIRLKDIQNNVINNTKEEINISIMTKGTNNPGQLIVFKDKDEGEEPAEITFSGDDLLYPFIPVYEILIPKDESSGDSGTFWIDHLDDPKFNFSLVVEAKTKIDQTITF
jgi:hypothetical protein